MALEICNINIRNCQKIHNKVTMKMSSFYNFLAILSISRNLRINTYSHLSNKRGAHAYQFWKIPPSSKKIPPPRLLISLLKCLILLQNLMTIFLTIILSYKTLFYLKNWCLLTPPHLVIFHFWHPSTFIPGSTFIREMRVIEGDSSMKNKQSTILEIPIQIQRE